MLTLGCRLRIGLRKPELPLRWSLRLRAIPCTVPCQGFHFPTFRASHHAFDLESAISLSRGCFVKEKLGQLWSMGTRTFQKVVWCSISVTGNDPGARGARSNANSLWRPDLAEPRPSYHHISNTWQTHGYWSSSPLSPATQSGLCEPRTVSVGHSRAQRKAPRTGRATATLSADWVAAHIDVAVLPPASLTGGSLARTRNACSTAF
jgi:hypothetical protein